MPPALYLNELDTAAIECWPLDAEEWLSMPERDFPVVAIPGLNGVVIAGEPTVSARELTLTLQVQPAARTTAARVTAERKLKAMASRGLVRIGINDSYTPSRVIDGVLKNARFQPVGHPIAAVASRASLTFLCPDPTWRDAYDTIIAFSATPSPIPTGDANSDGLIRIAAPAWSANVVNPTIHYLNAAGVTIKTLGLTGTLTAGLDYLEVDLKRASITEYASGAASNAIAWLTSGGFFAIDAMDGDPLNTSYPQLKVTATSGTPSGLWIGPRRWQ